MAIFLDDPATDGNPIQDTGDTAYTTTLGSAALAKTSNSSVEMELFDSGASRHMSGYRH
jgi:hypothetical protein